MFYEQLFAILGSITSKVAAKTQKASDSGFVTGHSFKVIVFGMWESLHPSAYQQRQVLESAPCTHNVPELFQTFLLPWSVRSVLNLVYRDMGRSRTDRPAVSHYISDFDKQLSIG